jgi:hypothetical protein
MAYPSDFYRIVFGGSIYAEKWNTSLNYFPTIHKPADASILATLASATQAFFVANGSPTGLGVISSASLDFIKVNRINTSGHYADPNPQTHLYPTPAVGTGTVNKVAPQLAVVASLLTDFQRGLANKGRMFLPPVAGYDLLGADGRASAAAAIRVASSVASYINQVNAAFTAWGGGGDVGHVAVISDKGAGAFHFVTKVAVGRVIDTMRSRRSSLPEDYQLSTTTIG